MIKFFDTVEKFFEDAVMRFSAFVLAGITLIQACVFAFIHQISGTVPSIHSWFWIGLPFQISRLWDLLLGPLFLYLLIWLHSRPFYWETDAFGLSDDESSMLGCFVESCLTLGFICGLVFGAVYFIPAVLIAAACFVIFVVLYLIWAVLSEFCFSSKVGS